MTDAYYIEITELQSVVKNQNNNDLEYANKLSLDSAIEKLRSQITESSLLRDKPHVRAESIWTDWFNTVNADVFISHSSANGDVAVQLANWLYSNFKFKSFVDSQFWLRINELQREFDKGLLHDEIVYDKYGNRHVKKYYDYEKRNQSTAHVHALLTYSLTKMIEKTPYFIFIKSANSVRFEDSVKNITSPWIFHELAIVDLMHNVRYQRLSEESFSELDVYYPMLGNCLKEITTENLEEWVTKKSGNVSSNQYFEILNSIINKSTNKNISIHLDRLR